MHTGTDYQHSPLPQRPSPASRGGRHTHVSAYHSGRTEMFLQMNRQWEAQWFIVLTGVGGILLREVGHWRIILVFGGISSRKVGVEDVALWSASFTGGSTIVVFLSCGIVIDVIRVSSVFALLGVAGTIPVYDSWETEKALLECVNWHFLNIGKTELSQKMVTVELLFFFIRKINTYTTCLVGGMCGWSIEKIGHSPDHSHTRKMERGKEIVFGNPLVWIPVMCGSRQGRCLSELQFFIPLWAGGNIVCKVLARYSKYSWCSISGKSPAWFPFPFSSTC